jgi:carbamoyltransferase
MNILGISAFYHDSAAALIRDGVILAAAQEERFSRIKHDARFPSEAMRYCLWEGGIQPEEVDAVVFYDKPVTKFGRILQTHLEIAPRGISGFVAAIPLWMREKLWIPLMIEKTFSKLGSRRLPEVYFTQHHEAHAASAYYPSPFDRAAILTLDGVGEWATTSLATGSHRTMTFHEELRFPHSLGLLYSAFTYFCGFRVNSGEYKLMGLAPYGKPRFKQTILDHLIDLKADGSFRLNMRYFGFVHSLRMTNTNFSHLFGGPPREPETPITQREVDLAASIQDVTEEVILRIARHLHQLSGETNLCMAGGVALNGVANGRLLREGPFKHLWIQPASGDAGGALGAALAYWHRALGKIRTLHPGSDSMQGSMLGPSYQEQDIHNFLQSNGYPHLTLSEDEANRQVAALLAGGKVVGILRGRMEFGPRALGCRSILGDPRDPEMQSIMNQKVKFRESFRPFAPACLQEKAHEYFESAHDSPYMLLVDQIKADKRIPCDPESNSENPLSQLRNPRSVVPAITHVNHSARVQTVNKDQHPRFHALICAFEALTQCPMVINTSFNVRGEPPVCTPDDAYRCFMQTGMDALLLENALLLKGDQPDKGNLTYPKNSLALD